MNARKDEIGPWHSMCLNRNSRKVYLYTNPKDYCDAWEEGSLGAIDAPENKGLY